MQRMRLLTLALSASLAVLAAGAADAAPGGGMGGGGMGGGMGGPGGAMGGPGMPMPPSTTETPSAADSSGLREGMTVKDSAGVTVGRISKVGKSGGAPAALVEVDGKTVVVMGSTLSVSGNTATSTQTKAQIEALPEPRPG